MAVTQDGTPPGAWARAIMPRTKQGLGAPYSLLIIFMKYRYIHANYRFVVDPRGDYRAQAIDADVHLDWNNVLQILVSSQSQLTNCPICLSTPVAPRMAKCGHIFCLPCLIRYMHSTDDTNHIPEKKARWKKCPICWDSVYISETRPVRWFTGQEGEAPREGADVVLRLIARQAGSTLALPRDGAESMDKLEDIPWYFAAEVADYARIMKGSEDYMTAQYEQEIIELQVQEKEDELMFGDETQWTKKAVSAIREAKERTNGMGNPPAAPKQPYEKKPKRPTINFYANNDDVPEHYMIQHDARSGRSSSAISTQPQTTENIQEDGVVMDGVLSGYGSSGGHSGGHNRSPGSISTIRPGSTASRSLAQQGQQHGPIEGAFYFYEALLHYYLSPLDIRILKAAFGDFASFPSTILPRVERVSTGHIVDDDLRKRAKYLAHLPHGCEIGLLECDWTDLVVPEVLKGFETEINRRRKKNQEKEFREEKERLRAEKLEDEQRWASARRRRPTHPSELASEADFQPLPRLEEGSEIPSSWEGAGMASASPPWPASSRQQTGSAFASLASPSTSPAASRTVWGTTAIPPSSPTLPPARPSYEQVEDDGWLQDWEKDLLQEDELLAQYQAHAINGESSKSAPPSTGKKKKNKKITLMTTNGRRAA